MTSDKLQQAQPELYTVDAVGYNAVADAFARDEENEQLYFLSMVGTQTSVKAIAAALLKLNPEPAYLSRQDNFNHAIGGYQRCLIPPHTVGTWTIKSKRLPRTKTTHMMIYTRVAEADYERDDFLLNARHEEELPTLYHAFLDRRSELPLHPSWTDWLWTRAVRQEEAVKLQSLGLTSYYCNTNTKHLRNDVGLAVATGGVNLEI